jgi:hypothetical protein
VTTRPSLLLFNEVDNFPGPTLCGLCCEELSRESVADDVRPTELPIALDFLELKSHNSGPRLTGS